MRARLLTFILLSTAFANMNYHDSKSQNPPSEPSQTTYIEQAQVPRSLLSNTSNSTITTTGILNLNFSQAGVSARAGTNVLILLTTYTANANSTGHVWAIYSQSHESPMIVLSYLNTPIALCVDVNNGYLYVIDSGYNSTEGVVYQYSATWNSISFDLNSTSAIVYQGAGPSDCDVDQYGNLYITDDSSQQVLGISLLNLQAQNYDYFVLYSSLLSQVSAVVSIDVSDGSSIYLLNGITTQSSGIVNNGTVLVNTTNEKSLETLVNAVSSPTGLSSSAADDSITPVNLAVSEERLYYTVDRVGLYVYDLSNSSNALKSNFSSPKGLCYSDGYVYVADANTATIYQLIDSVNNETSPTVYLQLADPYALECVNSAVVLAAYAVLYAFF